MGTSRQAAWRWLAAGVCLLTLGQAARADSLDEQRSRYAQIKQAWDNRQMDVVEQLMPTLQTYPLYPYLQYRQLTDDLMNEPTIAVQQFIQANPTLPPARTLTSRFVNELARREDWRGLLAFSPQPPGSTEAQCNYYYAKWNTGDLAGRERSLADRQKPACGVRAPLPGVAHVRRAGSAGLP